MTDTAWSRADTVRVGDYLWQDGAHRPVQHISREGHRLRIHLPGGLTLLVDPHTEMPVTRRPVSREVPA